MNYVNLKTNAGRPARAKKSGGKSVLAYLPIVAFTGLVILVAVNASRIKTALASMLSPVDIVNSIAKTADTKLKETDGRTNILLLGSDQRSFGDQLYSQLTDTLVVISVGTENKDVVMISIPRDLWVESSDGSRWKINELYGIYGGKDGTGREEVLKAVSSVLGIPIHYHSIVNFSMFETVIDTLGGVEVYVETAFEDFEYPIEGKEVDTCGRSASDAKRMLSEGKAYVQIFPCRYEHIAFAKGVQKMDGATALKYVRSRHGNNDEGTDFARAKRQQNLIAAVKEKALSSTTLLDFSKIASLFDLYAKNVDTNLDLSSVQLFLSLAKSSTFANTRSLVLDDRSAGENGGLLYAPTDLTMYGGKYVLIPKAGDYSQIHAYMQKYLFD
ncbi:TPA: hypothetical protein DCY43_01120 [candidate division WWE3 bacterium]|uniref:Cell envelope-related transcriptional attenuator n=3 Tax=Katanobacteria TaxID=422282 RepID=A0A0G1MWJ2_UNCKA|nr:MAG: Cell envelope-related transcriptional attenuator [candidate division WWE3 bacterium GW2011_GWC2_44_9]OGC51215.1 MAG: hypothetical protein A2709_01840 [candidate division WWE3 bacterium RIFCSPHIGHO2_01_FULL_43_9]HAZ29343.1 hypothetical protein [candidate division WWE3 bacterium]